MENNHTCWKILYQLSVAGSTPWSANYSEWRSKIASDVPLQQLKFRIIVKLIRLKWRNWTNTQANFNYYYVCFFNQVTQNWWMSRILEQREDSSKTRWPTNNHTSKENVFTLSQPDQRCLRLPWCCVRSTLMPSSSQLIWGTTPTLPSPAVGSTLSTGSRSYFGCLAFTINFMVDMGRGAKRGKWDCVTIQSSVYFCTQKLCTVYKH